MAHTLRSVLLMLVVTSVCPVESHTHTHFALSLYQSVAESDRNCNLVLSPASVCLSLRLLERGARGHTLTQLQQTLRDHLRDDVLLQLQNDTNISHVQLQINNTLLIRRGLDMSPVFTHQVSAWGNEHTLDYYTHTSAESTDAGLHDLQMMVLSSVTFSGTWHKHFHISETHSLPFTSPDGKATKVPMMHQAGEMNLGHFHTQSEVRYWVVELPYQDGSFSLLLVLLEDKKAKLEDVEKQLNTHTLDMWDTGLRKTSMDIYLPRFRVRRRSDMRTALTALGLSNMFNPVSADFTGITVKVAPLTCVTGTGGLYVSDAIHEATIEVSEEGSKAGGATALLLMKRSRSPVLKADRPFLFLLRHVSTGSVLFLGRVVNPVEQTL